jgi:choline dehydrogenase
MNKIDGKRMSAALGYLTAEVRARDNFRLRPETVVRRVLFDEKKRVRGVEVESGGGIDTIVTKKVVLASGAIATPGILLRSGVGPRAQVERLGVELVAEVPAVNEKLLDHPGAAIFFVGRLGTHHTKQALIQTVLRYTSKGSAHPNDMQIQPGSFLPLHPRLILPMPTLMCCVGKPRGHGRMIFSSADPNEGPRIYSDFLLEPDDREKALEALFRMYELSQTEPLRKLARLVWPTEGIIKNRERLGGWIDQVTGSGYHPCGTVPMGKDGDSDAATDSRGRVRGVEGLFVVDASLFPTVPSANTNLTALMFGERFGDWFRRREL